ncbi:16S rRNA (adenine(1518)-N(6)/adenine(1519)-N(6))-dimethyltransferase RsmA [Rudanella paleaurantiibacter]|uniref:Ribosomal RNA small subunit methyltransferase A n=1 Tax=Rudanella paleaurantiibacter TaxID=2614655 RepID=A0A7J5U7B1_9BACT|nr:16S rRNA (adenine(1518)-N(6)/adenine(1519)-N(6))-dimethyltransferase RsmA [Rudanella paleaurantiibacter]KAB7733040.1 16S rRNA (adenine(1518)-N(6)/adenine(1519)-N(6))-dimethyltransferase RsmA [Rudanella paleaurantiibacter]
MYVKPKKNLGQHFLTDHSIAHQIADLLSGHRGPDGQPYAHVLEIGPGTGVLTQFLLADSRFETHAIEIDSESVVYLKKEFPGLTPRLVEGDFLELTPADYLPNLPETAPFAIAGNFPYNISSQIFFKVLDYRDRIPEVVCMLQREVAMRLASPPSKKDYGILSVFLQAWYDVKYEFTVPPEVFNPPPKVHSGVISVRRNGVTDLGCNERKFIQVVKHGFNQRRKTLRNALKPLGITEAAAQSAYMDKRAEQLSVADFVTLTNLMSERAKE